MPRAFAKRQAIRKFRRWRANASATAASTFQLKERWFFAAASVRSRRPPHKVVRIARNEIEAASITIKANRRSHTSVLVEKDWAERIRNGTGSITRAVPARTRSASKAERRSTKTVAAAAAFRSGTRRQSW